MERNLLEIADLRPAILDTKKVENELTRSRFSASVRVLSVWCACNSSYNSSPAFCGRQFVANQQPVLIIILTRLVDQFIGRSTDAPILQPVLLVACPLPL